MEKGETPTRATIHGRWFAFFIGIVGVITVVFLVLFILGATVLPDFTVPNIFAGVFGLSIAGFIFFYGGKMQKTLRGFNSKLSHEEDHLKRVDIFNIKLTATRLIGTYGQDSS